MTDHFFTLSLDLLCILSLNGYFQQLNPAWEKTLGFTPSELMTKPLIEFIYPEDREATLLNINQLRTGVENITFETRFLCQDGAYKWLAWSAALNQEGGLIYAVARDMTQQKQSEAELLRTQQQLQHLLTYSPEILYSYQLSDNLKPTFISDNIKTLMGYEPSEFLENPSFWVNHIHPEDVADVIQGLSNLLEVGYHSQEYRFKYKDGAYQWIHNELRLVRNESGQPFELIGFWRDITQRKQVEEELRKSEQRLSLLFDQTPLAIIEWNHNFAVTRWNPAAEAIFGYSKSEAMGRDISDLILPEHEREHVHKVREQLLTHIGGTRSTNENITKDGRTIICEWYNTPLIDNDHNVMGAASIAQDITGSYQAQEELKRTQENLRKANELLEIRVEERTSELSNVIQQLEREFYKRQQVEKALYKEQKFLNALLENLEDGIVACDGNGVLTLFNSATREFHGISQKHIPPERWANYYDLYLPDGKTPMSMEDIPLFRAFQGEMVRDVEMVVAPKQGKKRTLLASGQPIVDSKGKKLGAVVTLHDITERKQAEKAQARLTTILEATIDFVATADANGNILYLNSSIRQSIGIDENEDISTLHLSELCGKSSLDLLFNQGLPAALKEGVWRGETALQRRDGQEIPVSQVLMAHKGENGEVEFLSTIARDITEQKHAEAALQESEAQYRRIVETATEGIWMLNAEGRTTFVNPQMAQMLGYTEAEMINQPLFNFIDEENQAIALAKLGHLRQGIQEQHDLKFTCKAETDLWAIVSANPIFDKTGEFAGVLGMVTDITSRKQAEELLAKQQQTLRAILDHAPIWIWMKDTQSKIQFINKTFCENVGIPESKFLTASHYLEILGGERSANCQASDAACWAQELPYHSEETLPFADGELHHLEITKAKIKDADGEVIGLLGLAVDGTERRRQALELQQSETRYKRLAQREALLNQLASDIRKSLNVDIILETAVQEIYNLLPIERCNFGWYRSQANPPTWDIVTEAKMPTLFSQLGSHPVAANSVVDQLLNLEMICVSDLDRATQPELQQLHREWDYSAVLSLPIKTPSGTMGLLCCAHHHGVRYWSEDEVELLQAVSDQLAIALSQAELYSQAQNSAREAQQKAKQLEETLHQLQNTQAQLIQTEKMSSLGQLVAGVAHEINNPVNFIYGNLIHAEQYTQNLLHLIQLYQQQYPNPPAYIQENVEEIEFDFLLEDSPKLLNSMKMGADRIRQIVLSLRNFSRLDEAEMKEVNIHEGIDNTLLILHNRIKVKSDSSGIKIVKEYGDLPLVECYAGQLNQVFMNIINNAIDAIESVNDGGIGNQKTSPSTPIIRIHTEVENRDWLMVKISDNGPGMTEAVKSRLFDPFFTTKSVGQGTGLGLSISYQIIVEKHGGSLECFSQPGKGAEFQIKIPIRQ